MKNDAALQNHACEKEDKVVDTDGITDMTIPIEQIESVQKNSGRGGVKEHVSKENDDCDQSEILLIPSLQTSRGLVGRKCRKKAVRKLSEKWGEFGGDLPKAGFRVSVMGGVVAEWKNHGVTVEFSRKLKRAWLDVSSPNGDWGQEFRLEKRRGWKNLHKSLQICLTSLK